MNKDRFTVMYRWRVKEGCEQRFIEGWAAVTKYHLENSGSYGSRLHKGSDGIFYAYAQWPSKEARDRAFSGEDLTEAAESMTDSVAERLPEVYLTIAEDLLA